MSESLRVDKVLSDLKNIFARIAGITVDQVEVDVTLLELGVDSLTMIQATDTIQRSLGVKIPFRVLVEDNPDLKQLAAYVESQMPAEEPQPEVAVAAVAVSNLSSSGVANMSSENPSVERTVHEVAKTVSNQSANGRKETATPNTALSRIIEQQLGLMAEQLQLLRGSNGKTISTPATVAAPAPREISAPASVEPAPAVVVVEQPSATPAQTTSESYVPYKPTRPGSAGGLSPQQQQHVDELIERFCKRTKNSKQQAYERRAILADSRTSAGFRLIWKEMLYTLCAERASGGRVWDIDGNEYVDIAMGYGALLFGHTPPSIEGLQKQFNEGIQMGLISHSVGQAAALVSDLTGVERVTFCNSGTEAVMIALRLARTVTGRSKIAFFEGSYHGYSDEVLVRPAATLDGDTCMAPIAPGITMSSAENVMVLEYGDPKSLEILSKHAHELAAVLVEPVQSRRPDLQPVEFLRELRKLTRESDTALIFDEVITGFRVHPGGAQALFGVDADLVTYGKGIGAGVPVAVVAGTAKYIDPIDGGQWNYGDKSFPRAERTYVAGTYFMHPVTMSAVCSALTHLKESGPQLQEQLNARTAELAATLNSYFGREEIPIQVVHFGSLFRFVFSQEVKLADLFFYHLLEKGVYTWEGRNCFLSTAHTDQDIDKIISAVKEAASEMRAGGFIPERTSQTEAAPAAGPRLVPTTIAQKELWILTQLGDDASRAYNESVTMHLRGPLDLPAMQRAIRKLIARHDALRTTFTSDGESQLVSPDISIDLSPVDFSHEDAATRESHVAEWLAKQSQQVFDLENGPLVHFGLAKVEDEYHLLVLTLHHIITDGWSNAVLLHDIGVLYAAECEGKENPLPPVMGFSEYAESQARKLQSEEMTSAQQYWLEQFSAPVQPLELPADRLRPPLQTYAGARQRAVIENSLLKQLRSVSGKHGSTLFVTLLAAFQLLLHRLSTQNDLVVGISAAGQPQAGDNSLVGYCTNLLPLRSRISENPSFKSYLAGVKKTVFDAYDHQIYPFGKLIRELKVARDPSRPPLVSVIFNMDTKADDSLPIPGLEVTASSNLPPVAKFDLNLNISQTADELLLDWEYNTDLFDQQTIERWQDHFRTLLESIVTNPEQTVFMMPMLRSAAVQQQAKQSKKEHEVIHRLFDAQAARTPEAVAVVYEDERLTYAQLNARANQLAHYLRTLGVGAETLVGVCMDRSSEMVVALLGVLKAGGAYLPLDPSYPSERLSFMLADAQASLLLTQDTQLQGLPKYEGKIVCLDLDWDRIARFPTEAPETRIDSDNLAYIVYTSGSTGEPKGVMVTHANVTRLFTATDHWFHFNDRDVWTFFHSYAFDFSVWELWGALLYGGRLVVVPYWVSRSPEVFYELLRREQVTVLNQTPSAFRQLIQTEESHANPGDLALRFVIFGGEALDLQMLQPWIDRHGDNRPQLVNMYGISETTVHVTYRPLKASEIRSDSGSVIGGPIPDLSLRLLDPYLQSVPVGVTGEMFIGGEGVARGYLNRPELTAERFIPDPFASEPGARLYRSGDVARTLANDDVEYLGRMDHQVKVRGFRIELGEIESVLRRHPAIREAIASLREDNSGEKRLIAYLIGDEQTAHDSLRGYLKENLPEYMIPSATVWLEAFPLTASGKIDRKALPDPGTERPELHELYVPPRTPTQEVMAAIWSKVLGVYPVGIHDNFFALGGDSIRGIQILGGARERGLQHFQLPDLFRYPTISELSQILAQKEIDRSSEFHTEPFSLISAEDRDKLPPEIEDAYPLTMLQSGMFYHMMLAPKASIYHNVNSLRTRGPFNLEAMREATQHLAARHSVLRTSFDFGTYSEPLQLVHKPAHLPVAVEDLGGLSEERQTAVINEYVESELTNFFDPAKPPLIRIKIHRLKDDEFQWTLTDFHLVIDGWAVATMISEISANYATLLNGGKLSDHESPLPVTFRDYVNLELSILRDEEVRKYLTQMMEGHTVAHLPRWPIQSQLKSEMEIQSLRFDVPDEILTGLQQLVRSEAIPLNYLLLVAHLKVISLLTGQEDVTAGLVVDGRLEEPGGEQVLGLYLNTMPLRLQLSPGSWIELAQRVFARVQSLLPHRRFPLAELQHELGGAPLFENMFYFIDFHNMHAMSRVGALKLVEGTHAFNNTHFPFQAMFSLDRGAAADESALKLQFDFDASQFHPQQVESINAYYHEALRRLVADPHAQHQRESLLSATEQRTMLVEWNETSNTQKQFATLQQLFDEQAKRTPDGVALVFEDRQMTYAQLQTCANQLAHYLRALGVGPETLVGISLERSLEMVIGLLGILKAGAAYVPLEPSYPQERLRLMIEEAGIRVVLTTQRFRDIVSLDAVESICLDADWDYIARERKENPAPNTAPGNLAYVIYTSGSTGKPKGSMITHEGICNRLLWMQQAYQLTAADRVLQKTPYTFDVSLWEFFWPLITGARLVLARPGGQGDSRYLLETIKREEITTMHFVPSMLAVFLEERGVGECRSLKRVICSGEALPYELKEKFVKLLPAELHNLYGPTEASVDVTYWDCRSAMEPAIVPIGRPIANTQIYVLDRNLQAVPVGVPGELYIGGVGLARGYLNRADLTAERFLPAPFGVAGARIYRTGDLARFHPDGTIEYLGRTDHQVKLRGFRIELGEIESALRGHETIKEAVVAVREDTPGDKRLVAYVIKTDPNADGINALRSYMKAKVPEYMIPAIFVQLDALPLTANGKVDRRALPAPDGTRPALAQDFVAPRTQIERLLTEIWSQALGVDQVGIDDDFFALGGDSIRSVQVVAKVQERGLNLSLQDLLKYKTIRELAQGAITARDHVARPETTRPFELISEADRLKLPPDVEDAYPLTMLQAGMIFHSELNPGNGVFHNMFSYHVRVPYNAEAMRTALESIVQRHASLRTSFVLHTFSEPLQLVVSRVEVPLHVSDLRDRSPEEQEKFLHEHLETERNRDFDLTRAPLLKIELHRRTDDSFQFTIGFHHAILDGWSVASMLAELFQRYVSLLEQDGPPTAVKPLVSAYRDYVAVERRALRSEEFRRYWHEKIDGSNDGGLKQWLFRDVELDTDASVHKVPFKLAPELATRLRELARSVSVPIKSVLLAAHLKVMSVLGGDSDVITGLVSHGRPEKGDGEQLVGMFLNTLPFRQQLQRVSWKDLVKQTFETEWEAVPYRWYPLAQMQHEHGGHELFATAFNFTHFHVTRPLHDNSKVEVLDGISFERTNLPLLVNFSLGVNSSEIFFSVEADAKRISKKRATMIAGYYLQALTAMANEPEIHHARTLLLSDEEREKVLVEWNQTAAEYPAQITVPQLFKAQVEHTPEAVALIFDNESITYDQLSRRANQLAHHLVRLGVGPEQLVGICMDRSIDMVVAILGVLKAGAAYLPLDPSYPRERLSFMISDAQPALVLTQQKRREVLAGIDVEVISLDSDWDQIAAYSQDSPSINISEENLFYVIYTSGSTGRPKGVLNLHNGAINRFRWMWERYPFSAGEVCCQKTSLSFGDSIWEIFGPLLRGVPSVILSDEVVKDPVKLVDVLSQQKVTRLIVVPSLLRMILDSDIDLQAKLSQLKYWTTSGEALSSELIEIFRQRLPNAVLLNLYGSSEVAADVTYCEVLRENDLSVVPIGRPIANTEIYLLDSDLQPVPVGVTGELYVGGVGLSRGYHNQPTLTADRFVASPFGPIAGARLYRSGDLARYRSDGTIEYLGRTDHQVKVRGFRVELGEVEAVLNAHDAVKKAVASVREDSPGDRRLVAYFVTNEPGAEVTNQLRTYVKSKVPDYMVPAAFVQLDKLPLTGSGKVDRQALPAPDQSRPMLEEEFVAPRNEVEAIVAQIWREVLKLERVGVNDNFFDVGGNSLSAMQIVAQVTDRFEVSLPLLSLFEAPTIAGLAQQIELVGEDSHDLQETI